MNNEYMNIYKGVMITLDNINMFSNAYNFHHTAH